MARRLRRRYGRLFGRKPQGPPSRKYLVYRHGEFFRSVSLPTMGATKATREDAAKRALSHEYGSVEVEEVS